MKYTDEYADDDDDEGLSIQEKSVLVSLIASTLSYVVFGIVAWQRYQAGMYDTNEALVFWSRAILILIGLYIVVYIIAQIVFHIGNTILVGEDETPGFEDERDKLFDLYATRNSSAVFGIGFLISMIALAFGRPAETMIIIMFIAMVACAIIGDVTKLVLYRRGN